MDTNRDGQMFNMFNTREKETKTTIKQCPIPVKSDYSQKTRDKCQKGCVEKWVLAHYCWECKLVQKFQKTVLSVLKGKGMTLKMELPFDLAIPPGYKGNKTRTAKRWVHILAHCSAMQSS